MMLRLLSMGLSPDQVAAELNCEGSVVSQFLVENGAVIQHKWATTAAALRAAQFARAMRGDCTAAAHLLHQRDVLMERMGVPTGIKRRAGRAR